MIKESILAAMYLTYVYINLFGPHKPTYNPDIEEPKTNKYQTIGIKLEEGFGFRYAVINESTNEKHVILDKLEDGLMINKIQTGIKNSEKPLINEIGILEPVYTEIGDIDTNGFDHFGLKKSEITRKELTDHLLTDKTTQSISKKLLENRSRNPGQETYNEINFW